MSTIRLSRALAGALFVISGSLGAVSAAQAWDQSRVNQPGSFEAIMSVKMPGVYGPHLPVPPDDPNRHYPMPGSAEALARAKTPWLFPTTSRVTPESASTCKPAAPGSFRALMSVKDPAHYGLHPCQ